MIAGNSGPIPIGSFDRNQLSIVQKYNANAVAPHAATQRWAYAVPSNRVALVEFAEGAVDRSGVAGVAGVAGVRLYVTVAVGVSNYILTRQINGNVIDAGTAFLYGGAMALIAGEDIEGYTFDTSTGGTIDYDLAIKASEFGA